MYPSISFTDPKFSRKVIKSFKSDGLAVITGVFDDTECDKYMDLILKSFVKLGTGIDLKNIEKHGLYIICLHRPDMVYFKR